MQVGEGQRVQIVQAQPQGQAQQAQSGAGQTMQVMQQIITNTGEIQQIRLSLPCPALPSGLRGAVRDSVIRDSLGFIAPCPPYNTVYLLFLLSNMRISLPWTLNFLASLYSLLSFNLGSDSRHGAALPEFPPLPVQRGHCSHYSMARPKGPVRQFCLDLQRIRGSV